jgi:hypothetical protein
VPRPGSGTVSCSGHLLLLASVGQGEVGRAAGDSRCQRSQCEDTAGKTQCSEQTGLAEKLGRVSGWGINLGTQTPCMNPYTFILAQGPDSFLNPRV